MKKSRELNMSIPEVTDKIDVREISENFEIIDKILSANLVKRNTSTTEINVTAYPPYYIMKNTENNPIDYFDPIFEETFTLGPLEEKKFFINAPQSLYITSDVQIEYDYFIPIQEAINDVASAIETLDVAAVSVGTAETIKSISETDGKIAVTKQSIAIKSNQVNGMTSYSKATSPSAIATSDSLNAAVGKLEYKVDTNETNISTLVQGLDTTNENVTTLTNDLAQVTQDVSNITSALNLYPENIAGVCVDYENKKYTRLSGAIGKTHGSDFDSFPVYSSMRRCNLADDGTVNAYYGDDTYVEDGSNGQVMVEIKKVYYKMNPVKLEKASSGYGYHVRKADYFVSHQQLPGFKLHPAFIVDGVEKDAIYMSAYEGSLYDTSASAYIMDDAQVADFSADKLCSIANAKPISGSSQALDRPNIEKLSTNRGAGWHVETVQMRSLIQLLMLIEYAGNIQTLLGRGIVDISDNSSYNCSSLNGSTSSLGNRSGMAASTIITKGTEQTTETANGKVAVSYRGIENPYGNIWKLVEGITMYGNGAMAGGMPYICDSTTFTENTTTGYTPAGFVVPKEGYISAFGYANEDLDWLFVASETNGSDSLPMGDYTYITKDLNGYHGGFIGGNWSSLSLAGCFFWRLNHSASRRNRAIGGRLCKI